MKRFAAVLALLLVCVFFVTDGPRRTPGAAATGNCGLAKPAFCDSFDSPHTVFNRSGQLDGNIWGVSRFTGLENISGQFNAWTPTTIQTCSGAQKVSPPNDVQICNGQLREAVDDNFTVAVLAMYPKQPFDFAGRTGTVTFDVSNDTQGSHAAWPEFWMSDKPVPAPFSHEDSWGAYPQHGFGIRFAAAEGPCGAGKWTVDGAVVSRNYVPDGDTGAGLLAPNSTLQVHTKSDTPSLDCVTFGSLASLNHIEVRVSQPAIDVWATDAGQATLKHIANIPNANLSFTRGLIWIQDAHYNGGKFGGQGTHTFAWDNVGFDGPFTYKDASYDVLDNTQPDGNGNTNLGWRPTPDAPVTLSTVPIDGALIPVAANARLLFNFFSYSAPLTFTYAINGHSHTGAWPYPDSQSFTPKTVAFDVPLSDLIAGPNTIVLGADQAAIVANVNIVLVNVSGGAPLPTATSAAPTLTPTASPSPSVTASSSPSPSSTLSPTQSPVATSSPLPTATPSADQCDLTKRKNAVPQWTVTVPC